MTTQHADSDGPSDLKGSPEPPQATEPELDAYGLPVRNRARTSRTVLRALASLIYAIVAVGLVIVGAISIFGWVTNGP